MKTFTIGKKKIVLKEEWMVGFITTWIVGLLAHAYRFFNFLPIWDSIYNFTGVGSTYTLGRWFLGYAGLITSMFDLPWVNGAFSLFYISIVVILFTEMFEIKNKGMIVLCAAIFVSFPTVVSSFAYMYTADAYLLAFLLATLAVYLTWCVKKWGTIAGMVCLAFAMGIYQAYATVAIVLVLIYIIRQFVIEKLDFLEAVRKDLKYLGTLVGGAVLYAIILKSTLIRYKITLPSYQGIGSMGIMSLGQYKAALQKTLYHFRLILGMEHGVEKHVYSLLNAAALLLIGLILIYLLVRNQVYKKKMSMLASIAAVCLIPVGAYFINFTSPDVQYYTLMEMAVCLIYLLMIIMLLQLDWKTWISKILKGCGIFVLCGLVYYNVINCNIAYFNMNLSYHKSISIAEDVLQRIEQMDEFQNQHDKIVIMGDYNCATENLQIMMPSIMGISNDSFLNDSYHYTIIWNYCFGVQMEQASYDEMMEIVETDEYKNMSVYPLKGCVEYINGIIVVKMQE